MLGGHEDVLAPAEPWLMLPPLYARKASGIEAEYGADWARLGLSDFLEHAAGGDAAYDAAVRAMAAVLYGRALARAGKRLLLDKTPRYYLVIPELLRVFPKARFLFLQRNPLSVLRSILDAWVRQGATLSSFHSDLLQAPRLILDGRDLAGGRGLTLRYEDLVTQPGPTLRVACDHLGLPFREELLRYRDSAPPQGRLGDFASTALRDAPAPDRLERWRELSAEPGDRDLAAEYLERLGPEVVGRMGYDFDAMSNVVRTSEARGASRLRPSTVIAWPVRTSPFPARMSDGSPWPRISIVTPSMNQARFLDATIRSVLSQGYPNLEYIVVDGGSSDGSQEIIRRYQPWLAHAVSEPDAGQYDALNKGFARATGEILAWINADDVYCPWSFAIVAAIFRDLPEVKWLTSSTLWIWDEAGAPAEMFNARGYTRNWFYRGRHLLGERRFTEHVMQEATFWRRELWQAAGARLDASLQLAGDFELWARFWEHADLVTTSVPLAGFRRHPAQKTARMKPYLAEARAVLARHRHKTFQSLLLVALADAFYRLTGRAGRLLGSRRHWVSRDPRTGHWVCGWDIEV